MKIIGVTGNSGSGKSTVVRLWESLGTRSIDCDEIYHGLLMEGGPMFQDIADSFPSAICDGALNRRLLGKIVFSDPDRLALLNTISHRYVVERVRQIAAELSDAGTRVIAVEALYLLESELARLCGVTVGVVSPDEKRLNRIIARDNLERDYAMSRLRAQMDNEYFIKNCDMVIINDGSLEELEKAAGAMHRSLLADV